MYGGTLDASDLSQIGTFAFDVTGEESLLDDPNHVIIEPPPGGVPDNLTVQDADVNSRHGDQHELQHHWSGRGRRCAGQAQWRWFRDGG